MTVTRHAIEQYARKIIGVPPHKEVDYALGEAKLKRLVSRAKPVQLSKKEAMVRLLHNDYIEAEYLEDHGVLFVVTQGAVVTCYPFNKRERI